MSTNNWEPDSGVRHKGDTSIKRKTLERISDDVIAHVKNTGSFDHVREDLMPLIERNKDYEAVEKRYKNKCESYLSDRSDLHEDRRILRTNLQRYTDTLEVVNTVQDLIRKILKESDSEIRAKYLSFAEPYLRGRFLPPETPQQPTATKVDSQIGDDEEGGDDMDIDSSGPESPQAPEFSPISNHGDEMEISYDNIDSNSQTWEPNVTIKQDEPPSLDDIPIPPEECPDEPRENQNETSLNPHLVTPPETVKNEPSRVPEEGHKSPVKDNIPEPVKEDELTTIKDEPSSQNPIEDTEDLLTFSSVSSVRTADLSDFDESIKLSDDEANIVGQPRNSKIRIEVLQSTISDLQTKTVECQPDLVKQETRDQAETGESDGCSDGLTTGRRATRTRKSNPRYSNDNYTY